MRRYGVVEALLNLRVWAFVLVYFGYTSASTVVAFFLPQIIKSFGVSIQMTGYVSALPYAVGLVAMIFFSLRPIAPATGRCMPSAPAWWARWGWRPAAWSDSNHTVIMTIALIVGIAGVQSFGPLFWPIPTAMLSGIAAAGGVALINSMGNISGLIAPTVFGLLKDAAGGKDNIALLVISFTPMIAAIVLSILGHDRRLERIPRGG